MIAKEKNVIIIPSREGSTRFPGKPRALISGKSLLYRTWLIAKSVKNADAVYVATDSEKIAEQVESFGGKFIMTTEDCENGTERTLQALGKMGLTPEISVNLQGDAVLTPPWVIETLIGEMENDKNIGVATPAVHLSWDQFQSYSELKKSGKTSGTLVTFDLKRNALYFSKGLIPLVRDHGKGESPFYRHIGLYGYRYLSLQTYKGLHPGPLENAEKLEQLRYLENGYQIKVVLVDYRGRTHWSVDHPEDIPIVEKIISQEGELV